uniref:Secreted protein n=1 Tax=Moniliophthora roreri TaxID=221103 RepID=A0A0W0F5T1_MONRR
MMRLAFTLLAAFATVTSVLVLDNVGIINPPAEFSISNMGTLNITFNPGRSVKASTINITAYLIPAEQSQLTDGGRKIHTSGYQVEVDLSRWSTALANGAEMPWKLWIEEKFSGASPFDFAIWAQGITIQPQ